jgi:hypothetical protein
MIKKILLLLLVVIAIAMVAFWFNREQWLSEFNQERQQQSALFELQGSQFAASGNNGESADQQQCLEESFKQMKGCFEFSCTLNQAVFLKSCLATSQKTERFCGGVPEYKEKLSTDDKQWLKDSCWNKNINGEGCRFLYKQQIHYCSAATINK